MRKRARKSQIRRPKFEGGLETGLRSSLTEPGTDDFAGHIGEPIIAALETIGERLVIQAKEMEQCRVKVVDVHRIFGDGHSEVVGFAVNGSTLHAAAGHPEAEGRWLMIAPGNCAHAD